MLWPTLCLTLSSLPSTGAVTILQHHSKELVFQWCCNTLTASLSAAALLVMLWPSHCHTLSSWPSSDAVTLSLPHIQQYSRVNGLVFWLSWTLGIKRQSETLKHYSVGSAEPCDYLVLCGFGSLLQFSFWILSYCNWHEFYLPLLVRQKWSLVLDFFHDTLRRDWSIFIFVLPFFLRCWWSAKAYFWWIFI